MEKVNILGTEYEIILDALEKDYPKLKNVDGYCDFSIKQIVVANLERDEQTVQDLSHYSKKVLRHEIVHAFIYESGLAENCEWARDEAMTDWIAIQFEKLLEVFIELKAIKLPEKNLYIDLKANLDEKALRELLNQNINKIISIGGEG